MFLGAGQFRMPSTFFFCISTPFSSITTSRNSTFFIFYQHFLGFMKRSFSLSHFSTSSTILPYLFSVSVATIISSIKVAVFSWFTISWNRLFIIVWKVAGEFVSPKYITVSSYTPICVVNAIFYLSSSLILILLYLHLRSSFVKTFLLPTPSRMLVISGNGYLFLIVHWFICL